MNTAIINIKVEPETKAKAQATAKELGLSLSGIINAYLKQFVKTKSISFAVDNEIPNAETTKAFKETEKYVTSEEFKREKFSNEEAFAYLDQLIAREKADRQR